MHPLVRLARQTIELYVREKRTPDVPETLPEELPPRAGVFVSIHAHGLLRGCIGTIEPAQGCLADEVIQNAISAATRDPRFQPLRPEELAELEIKVDVLTEPELVHDRNDLDPRRYGVIVQSQRQPWKRGLLLPDLEGVDTVDRQLEIARSKAWLGPDEPVQVYRFSVNRLT